MSAGILSKSEVQALMNPTNGTVRLWSSIQNFEQKYIGLSAFDLPLGEHFWEMRGSCRTGSHYKVLDLIRKYAVDPNGRILGDQPTLLSHKTVYLFKVDCGLDLNNTGIVGKASGKSSVGRLDCLVRLLVDESSSFDSVPSKKLELYVEVTPISFDLEVKRGTALSQLRLFKGKEAHISLTNEELDHEEDDTFPVFDENGKAYREPCVKRPDEIWFPFCLDLRPDSETRCSAFVARNDTKNLPPINPDLRDAYDPHSYWESIEWENEAITLEPDRLYILRSLERLRIPNHLALECKSYTTEMGEWRIEYAGFAHPFFGRLRTDGKTGSPIIFEVRGHNVKTILTHKIPLGNVRFLRMAKPAVEPKEEQAYEKQELALSKCFKPWAKP